ncbi:DUF3842 family protein [Fusibacter ferrireducens]|uniref:DUF3842 family protein n=1 Tax=Fusibacter ferrireducens TaxID=2785058 RepID=A0ABR9ZQE5_9FIRM|nr:DUF3842 family protein [Fusibacter ferrireducens]MBF4692669.1 DUF3842 family protein [Fusibacter ferrireducens]
MKIAVIDGQGGGIGKALVEAIKAAYSNNVLNADELEIFALGTNALATSLMLRAGAHHGATGENAIVVNAPKMDIIMGPIGIISANALLGELTPKMAEAISSSEACKILIPIHKCNITVAGVISKPLAGYIEDAIEGINKVC